MHVISRALQYSPLVPPPPLPLRQHSMTVRLAVAGAFHTDFMQPAVAKLQAALDSTPIQAPRIPVISNVDAQPHSDPAVIRSILARQVGWCWVRVVLGAERLCARGREGVGAVARRL